jgi:hypothetical protein
MLGLGLIFANAGGAYATSIVTLRPHDPEQACFAIKDVVSEMTGKKRQSNLWPLYYDDKFGVVEYHERDAFIKSMNASEGKPDKSAIVVTNVWPVGKRDNKSAKALYVVGLERYKWLPERESSFDPMNIEPEGYEFVPSYWLAEFSENRVVQFREGFHFFDFIDYDKRLKGCGNG